MIKTTDKEDGKMACHYQSRYVVCPFYRRNEPNRICCEGVGKGNTINLVFESQPRMHNYIVKFCNDMGNYHNCLICQMLEGKEEYK